VRALSRAWQIAATFAAGVLFHSYAAALTCSSPAPVVFDGSGFAANGVFERLEARGPHFWWWDHGWLELNLFNHQWEWALGADVRSANTRATHDLKWVPGRTYSWSLNLDGAGNGTLSLNDPPRSSFTITYKGGTTKPLRTGNAIALNVSSGVGLKPSNVTVALNSLNGQATSVVLAASEENRTDSRYVFFEPMKQGIAATGTITLGFPAFLPFLGAPSRFTLNAGNVACDGGGTGAITITTPMPAPNTVLPAGTAPTISAAFQTTGPAINPSSARLVVNGVDVTAGATTSASGISYQPPQPLPEGTQSVQASIDDGRGGRAVLDWTFIIRSLPIVAEVTPQDVTTANNRPPLLARFEDVGGGINPASVRLLVDGADVTAQATVDAVSVSYTPVNPLTDGTHTASVSVSDTAGNSVTRTWSFTVAAAPPPIGSSAGTRGTLQTPVVITPTN
jgi:Bacterial Ig-like domain